MFKVDLTWSLENRTLLNWSSFVGFCTGITVIPFCVWRVFTYPLPCRALRSKDSGEFWNYILIIFSINNLFFNVRILHVHQLNATHYYCFRSGQSLECSCFFQGWCSLWSLLQTTDESAWEEQKVVDMLQCRLLCGLFQIHCHHKKNILFSHMDNCSESYPSQDLWNGPQ